MNYLYKNASTFNFQKDCVIQARLMGAYMIRATI